MNFRNTGAVEAIVPTMEEDLLFKIRRFAAQVCWTCMSSKPEEQLIGAFLGTAQASLGPVWSVLVSTVFTSYSKDKLKGSSMSELSNSGSHRQRRWVQVGGTSLGPRSTLASWHVKFVLRTVFLAAHATGANCAKTRLKSLGIFVFATPASHVRHFRTSLFENRRVSTGPLLPNSCLSHDSR